MKVRAIATLTHWLPVLPSYQINQQVPSNQLTGIYIRTTLAKATLTKNDHIHQHIWKYSFVMFDIWSSNSSISRAKELVIPFVSSSNITIKFRQKAFKLSSEIPKTFAVKPHFYTSLRKSGNLWFSDVFGLV